MALDCHIRHIKSLWPELCTQVGEPGLHNNNSTFPWPPFLMLLRKSRFYLVFYLWHNADHSKCLMNIYWIKMNKKIAFLPSFISFNPWCLGWTVQLHLWGCLLSLVPGLCDVGASPHLVSWWPPPGVLSGGINLSYPLYTPLL